MAKKKYVIIGNGAAGISAAEAIRGLDLKVNVMVISEEPHAVYSKVLLHHYVGGGIEETGLFIRPKSHYKKIHLDPLLGRKVERVFPKDHSLLLQDGSEVDYDKLLMATGSLPWKPPLPGINLDGIYTFWTLEDARRIRSALRKVKKVIVLGSSFLGMQVLDALSKYPLDLTVVDIADQVMPGRLDQTSSHLLQDHLEERGVRFFLGVKAKEIQSFGNDQKGLILEDGRTLLADMIILTTGAKPNAGMIEDPNSDTHNGLPVDQHMRTVYEDVYAAGDTAETHDCITGERKTFGLWTAAIEQGRIAGLNMAGKESVYSGGLDMNATHIAGLPIVILGHTINRRTEIGWDETVFTNPSQKRYRKFTYFRGKLMGAILMGSVEDAGVVGHMIRSAEEMKEADCHGSPPSLRVQPLFVKKIMKSSCWS